MHSESKLEVFMHENRERKEYLLRTGDQILRAWAAKEGIPTLVNTPVMSEVTEPPKIQLGTPIKNRRGLRGEGLFWAKFRFFNVKLVPPVVGLVYP